MAERIRVVLRWVQILDIMEPFFKHRGEFRFSARVTSDKTGRAHETRFPTDGYYEISDHPAWNKLKLDKVIFEGEVDRKLVVEIMGEELDSFTAADRLDHYKREFAGVPRSWIGGYGPGAESDSDGAQSGDPEEMSKWRVNYVIERV
ncbi:MAG: hypothetical protein ACREMQ_04655 [Longimicrobiales bacterium]